MVVKLHKQLIRLHAEVVDVKGEAESFFVPRCLPIKNLFHIFLL